MSSGLDLQRMADDFVKMLLNLTPEDVKRWQANDAARVRAEADAPERSEEQETQTGPEGETPKP